MNASQIISTFRTRCSNVSSAEFSDADALNLANIAYSLTVNTIRSKINEDFGADIFVRDLIAGQYEYSFDTRGDDYNTRTPINKVTKVAIKYGDKYVFASPFSTSTQDRDDTELATDAVASAPMYKISDYSLFIYPTPTERIVGGLKVYGLYDPIPLTLITQEADIMVPPSHHWVITSHMMWLYFEATKQGEEANARAKAELDESKMITELSNRMNGELVQYAPSLKHFS